MLGRQFNLEPKERMECKYLSTWCRILCVKIVQTTVSLQMSYRGVQGNFLHPYTLKPWAITFCQMHH